jgi:hypothetical protein
MNLPSNTRSLVAVGIFCAVAGAWLTFVTEARTRSLRGETSSEATSQHSPDRPGVVAAAMEAGSQGARSPELTRAEVGEERWSSLPPSSRRRNDGADQRPRVATTEVERVAAARRQLEFLELQKPENFLAIFDVMKHENGGNPKQLETARAESHRYIIARTKVLERMLRRFIDDPGADQGLEKDALAHLDETFRAKVGSLARDIPGVVNIQEILTTTTLKAPAFAEPPADEAAEPNEDVVDRNHESDQSSIQSTGAAHDQSRPK